MDLATPYITIRLNSRVVDLDPSVPSVTLASGEVVKADLVIGADGLHSRVRDTVVGRKDNPVPTGDAAYRATIPADLLLADPELKFLVEDQPLNIWIGPGRRLVAYPIVSSLTVLLVKVVILTSTNSEGQTNLQPRHVLRLEGYQREYS